MTVLVRIYAGDDWITSGLIGSPLLDAIPRVGEIVEVQNGDKEPLQLPVTAVKHIISDSEPVVHLLVQPAVDIDAWIESFAA